VGRQTQTWTGGGRGVVVVLDVRGRQRPSQTGELIELPRPERDGIILAAPAGDLGLDRTGARRGTGCGRGAAGSDGRGGAATCALRGEPDVRRDPGTGTRGGDGEVEGRAGDEVAQKPGQAGGEPLPPGRDRRVDVELEIRHASQSTTAATSP